MAPLHKWLGKDPKSLIVQLRQLATDLERIEAGVYVMDAPVTLGGWAVFRRTVPCLVGMIEDHPTVADGHPAATTELFYLDREKGHARTLNHWYRLQDPVSVPARNLHGLD